MNVNLIRSVSDDYDDYGHGHGHDRDDDHGSILNDVYEHSQKH